MEMLVQQLAKLLVGQGLCGAVSILQKRIDPTKSMQGCIDAVANLAHLQGLLRVAQQQLPATTIPHADMCKPMLLCHRMQNCSLLGVDTSRQPQKYTRTGVLRRRHETLYWQRHKVSKKHEKPDCSLFGYFCPTQLLALWLQPLSLLPKL